MALGAILQSPETDRYGYSRRHLRGRIVGALGGRAAEELGYGDLTTGAEDDLEQATRIARQMVGRWGMSEAVGPVSLLPDPRTEQPVSLDAEQARQAAGVAQASAGSALPGSLGEQPVLPLLPVAPVMSCLCRDRGNLYRTQ